MFIKTYLVYDLPYQLWQSGVGVYSCYSVIVRVIV